MKFGELVDFFEKIEATSSRNEKTVILAEILQKAEIAEVDKLVYLALGGLRPAFERLEFNLAEKMILRSLGVSWQEYQEVGDLGELVAKKEARSSEHLPIVAQGSELEISEVYGELEKIARESGSGSQERKVAGLAKLMKAVGARSAKYIVRIVAGKLRLGFSEKTIIDALSYWENGNKDLSEQLEAVYQMRPDPGYLAKRVKEVGSMKAIATMSVTIGTPIVPALAQRLKTAQEMIEKMGRVIVEKKFDGTRVQIHFSRNVGLLSSDHSLAQGSELGGQARMFEAEEERLEFWVRTFTRNLDESSAMFPELQRIAGQIKADEVILDSEAVGYDPQTGKLVPFQLTITRKRKHGIGEASDSVPLRFFVFDIMYLNGKSLIDLPLKERKKILRNVIREQGSELGTKKFGTMGNVIREQGSKLGDVLVVDDFVETDDPDVLREYHRQQLEAGLEGALVKQVEGKYMPGRVGFNWVKFKEAEDSRAKLSDTLDLVIMGYYLGKGKRSDFGLGAFLVGVRSGEEVVTLAKVGTGITDEMFRELSVRLNKITIKTKEMSYQVPKSLEPDVWVEPKIIVEIAADEITISPTHTAGYALRFPRMVKFRDDKNLDQITTLEEIKVMAGV